MRKYIIRRLLVMIPILLGVSIVVFILIANMPGDAVDVHMATARVSAEKIAQNRALLGLDKPVIERYFIWLSHAIRGDFGTSLSYAKPVFTVIGDFVWNSFLLALVAYILELLIAIPVGVVSAVKQYAAFDNIFTVIGLAGISLPSFFLAMLLQYLLTVRVNMFPLSGMFSVGVHLSGPGLIFDLLWHMVLPVFTLTALSVGSTMRYVRTSMLEVIHQDYVRTAQAKGLPERVVIYKHALKNGIIPVITFAGGSLPNLFGGAIITESVFAWPGIGKAFLYSINQRDYLFMMGFIMFVSVLVMLGNLISDVLYGVVDPRIRLQ